MVGNLEQGLMRRVMRSPRSSFCTTARCRTVIQIGIWPLNSHDEVEEIGMRHKSRNVKEET